MSSLADIRDGLADAMGTISGLRTSATVPDYPRPPIAIVMPDRIVYDLNANRGADTYFFTIMLLVGRADDRAAQNNLDAYIVGTGSIKAAVESDRTLGGVANTCRVTEMGNYSSMSVGDTLYLAASFTVEVVA
ncbi:MAG TPA: hypothetical protein VIG24_10875 [Acidimicrobiia bacterium]